MDIETLINDFVNTVGKVIVSKKGYEYIPILSYKGDWNTLIPVIQLIKTMYPYAESGAWYDAYQTEIELVKRFKQQVSYLNFSQNESSVKEFIETYNQGLKKYGDY